MLKSNLQNVLEDCGLGRGNFREMLLSWRSESVMSPSGSAGSAILREMKRRAQARGRRGASSSSRDLHAENSWKIEITDMRRET